jgi:hypothetical protein
MSTRSNSSTISELLDAKVREFELDIEYTSQCRKALTMAYEANTFFLIIEYIQSKDYDTI